MPDFGTWGGPNNRFHLTVFVDRQYLLKPWGSTESRELRHSTATGPGNTGHQIRRIVVTISRPVIRHPHPVQTASTRSNPPSDCGSNSMFASDATDHLECSPSTPGSRTPTRPLGPAAPTGLAANSTTGRDDTVSCCTAHDVVDDLSTGGLLSQAAWLTNTSE